MWWLSTRVIRRAGEPEWADYINFLGLTHLHEIRSIDSWCNPHAEGSDNYALRLANIITLAYKQGEIWLKLTAT